MKVVTCSHMTDGGWGAPLPAELDSAETLVVAFGAPSYVDNASAFADLVAAFPASHLIGCSTAGEIQGSAIRDGSLSVAVARFERTRLSHAVVPITDATSFAAGAQLGQSLLADDLRAVLVLSSGHGVNGTQLAAGLESVVGGVPVSGGLAADGTRFQNTWVLDGGRPRAGVACAVGFYGSAVRIGHGSKGGWDKFGPERRITRARGNVLLELDGRPALELYKTYLGELASGLPATALLYPLAIRTSHASEQLVRTVLAHSEAEQSLTFAGDMPEGAYAQLMRANFNRLVEAASSAVRDSVATTRDDDTNAERLVAHGHFNVCDLHWIFPP